MTNNTLIQPSTSNETPPQITLPANVKSAMLDFNKSVELRAWVSVNKEKAINWRGADGESMLHWVFLTDWVLASDIRDYGLDFSVLDDSGRSPMDWLNDRLWMSLVTPTGSALKLSAGSKERLKIHSENQIQHLWRLGARPSEGNNQHPGLVWMRSGCFSLMELLVNSDDKYSLLDWMPESGSAMHAWPLAPNYPDKWQFIKKWLELGYDIDVVDENGRTPLWYAAELYRTTPEMRQDLMKSIETLIEFGADPDHDDDAGFTPRHILRSVDIDLT